MKQEVRKFEFGKKMSERERERWWDEMESIYKWIKLENARKRERRNWRERERRKNFETEKVSRETNHDNRSHESRGFSILSSSLSLFPCYFLGSLSLSLWYFSFISFFSLWEILSSFLHALRWRRRRRKWRGKLERKRKKQIKVCFLSPLIIEEESRLSLSLSLSLSGRDEEKEHE